jgi:hypothetical protein
MKKHILSAASALIAFGSFAQLPVSTTPENKNTLLEEFTGIYCQFCPDGHKRANDLAAANPGDVFLINIHTGGYANPQAGDPDFRTPFGTAIAGQSGLTGYPAGTINRHLFNGLSQGTGTAMSRGNWATAAGQIMSEASYVNVALEADIDVATRVMTIDLQAYFTANGASSVNINVAITQDNIEGPQTGASTWYPSQILPNGNYVHNHMLRHLVTGQWGEVVSTTTMGTTVTKQYTWNIPTDITGVPVEIGDLNVVAFIVEGQQEVITANDGPISFTVPPGTTLVDLTSSDALDVPSSLCASSITPKITVTNNETASCSGYVVSYSLNGGTPVSQTITTALAGGASATHTFPSVSLGGGVHNISYTVALPQGSNDIEIVTGNNNSSSVTFSTIEAAPIGTSFSEDFESYADGTEAWDNTAMNPNSDYFVISQTMFSGINNPLGGYAASTKSFRHRLFNFTAGQTNEIVTYKVDFSQLTFGRLTFDYACAGLTSSFTDKLEVFASSDCGTTWTSVWSKSGSDIATGPANSQNTFYPTATQWATANADVSAFGQVGEVIFKFVVTGSGNGNCLYLDNINTSGSPLSVEGIEQFESFKLFPNPAVDNTTLEITADQAGPLAVRIYDMTGRSIQQFNQTVSVGTNMINLNTQKLSNGVYFVEVSSANKTTTERLVIQK